jgi:hypothetical protein
MTRYRKILTGIWNDEGFRRLSDDGQLIFFFLNTHPQMTALGAMRHTIPGLAAEKGWKLRRFSEAFHELISEGEVQHDTSAAFVWLTHFIQHNRPENANVVIAMGKAATLLPECDLKRVLCRTVTELLKGYGKGYDEAFAKPFPEGSTEGFPKPFPEPFPKGMPTPDIRYQISDNGHHKRDTDTEAPAPILRRTPKTTKTEMPPAVPRKEESNAKPSRHVGLADRKW